MLAKTPIKQRFYNWVAAQPPDKQYNYQSCSECGCGQFLINEMKFSRMAVVMKRQFTLDTTWLYPQTSEDNQVIAEVWETFDNIARGNDDHTAWTFGKLAQRIREQMPECVA